MSIAVRDMKDCEICKRRGCQVEIAIYLNDKLIQLQVCNECATDCRVDFEALEKGTVPDFIEQCLALDEKRQRDGIEDLSCPECGLTANDFEETSQLGCSNCYSALRDLFDDRIAESPTSQNTHKGKKPPKPGESVVRHYSHFFRVEQQAYERSVSDWERERYFERI